jgi:hypothetical protein
MKRKKLLLVSMATLVALFILCIAVYDGIAFHQGTQTLSMSIWLLCKQEPIVPALSGLVIGILIGHLTWRIQE